jgi:hypothetical protein
MLIQVVVTIFVLFAASRILLQYKNEHVGIGPLLFWLLIWGGVLVVVYWPDLIDRLASIFGVGRGIDVLVYFSLVLLFYLIYRIYIHLENLERQITKLVRHDALKDLDKKK